MRQTSDIAPEADLSLSGQIMQIISRVTEYELEELDPALELEADLGIDSLVTENVLEEVEQHFGLDAPMSIGRTRCLGDFVDAVAHALPKHAREGAPGNRYPAENDVLPDEFPAESTSEVLSAKDFAASRGDDLFTKAHEFAEWKADMDEQQLIWYGKPHLTPSLSRSLIHDPVTESAREYLVFASNDYLGLANDPRVKQAAAEAILEFGVTNTGCRMVGGTNRLHVELEEKIAAFKGKPSAIVFPGGYSANLGTIGALLGANDTIVLDQFNHMSIMDGAVLSGARRRTFVHNDMDSLETILTRSSSRGERTLIAVDGVFSMHGDICDLPRIVDLASAYGARVLVDDAHATGVIGPQGRGTAAHFGLTDSVDLELGTMSKALGALGGFVAGETDVIEYLRMYAHSYVFAATIPAGIAASVSTALDIIVSEPERLERLTRNRLRLVKLLNEAGLDSGETSSAVVPVLVGDEQQAMRMGREVRSRGLFCQTVVYPGVPLGDARLRLSVTSEHSNSDLQAAVEIIVEARAAVLGEHA